jgi:hypothetical protein
MSLRIQKKNSRFKPYSSTPLREYILFRDVEHCRNQFRPRISSIQFRELELPLAFTLMHSSVVKYDSVRSEPDSGTEFRKLSGGGIVRNAREFLPIPEFR